MVPLFNNQANPGMDVDTQVLSMRSSGLTDDQILNELKANGVQEPRIISALTKINSGQMQPGMQTGMQANMPGQMPNQMPGQQDFSSMPQDSIAPSPAQDSTPSGAIPGMLPTSQSSSAQAAPDNLYSRIEEITEEIIDEKWDDLIKEVQKIISWKNRSESRIQKLEGDLQKLKGDFKTLHEGVLGKVQEYDERMREVGTELKAVGKVFKDVIPVFTENVKELRDITKQTKEAKGQK